MRRRRRRRRKKRGGGINKIINVPTSNMIVTRTVNLILCNTYSCSLFALPRNLLSRTSRENKLRTDITAREAWK
jgi:hypothetical protein